MDFCSQHSKIFVCWAAAGRMVVKDGVLKAIWPYNGHYLPTKENFEEFISFLQDNNVDVTDVKRHSVDDGVFPSTKSSSNIVEVAELAQEESREAKESKEVSYGYSGVRALKYSGCKHEWDRPDLITAKPNLYLASSLTHL